MTLKQIRDKYLRLPGSNFYEKSLYLSYWFLKQNLYSRWVVDSAGLRVSPKCIPPDSNNTTIDNKTIICTTGFGHTGSGAVVDLISEYDNVDVLAYIDKNGSLRKSSNNVENGEFVLLISYGGLLDLEHAFSSPSIGFRDASLKLFLRLVAYLYTEIGGYYNNDFLKTTRDFVNNLISWKNSPGSYFFGYEYSPHLTCLGNAGERLVFGEEHVGRIFHLKDITIQEYRELAKTYIHNLISRISPKRCLVLDQALSNGSVDMERHRAYLGPFKQIACYRDPRDVYVTARMLHEVFIPNDVIEFVDFYRRSLSPYINLVNQDFLMVRFENLVRDYDKSVAEIEHFIGFTPQQHVHKKSCFDPMTSNKNIGLYKDYPDQQSIKIIESELKEFVYK